MSRRASSRRIRWARPVSSNSVAFASNLFPQGQQEPQLSVLSDAFVPPGVGGEGEKDAKNDDGDLEASSLEPALRAG